MTGAVAVAVATEAGTMLGRIGSTGSPVAGAAAAGTPGVTGVAATAAVAGTVPAGGSGDASCRANSDGVTAVTGSSVSVVGASGSHDVAIRSLAGASGAFVSGRRCLSCAGSGACRSG